uniref:Uncharacterized protein n=1 Tax=Avena sativa TaxID=4498 RepID=A0ACD5XXK3_AVESA
MPSSSSIATDLDASAAVLASGRRAGRGRPEDFASFLRTQDEVDALCDKYVVPVEFTARPAGKLQRANSKPPRGAICVHGRALEAGMCVPLQGFFREVLAHFGIAPAQLTPNGWRVMAGFLALCRSHGVSPSLAVFRYFFMLCIVDRKHKVGWYFFRSRDSSRLRFTGMPNPSSISNWKLEFFFLSSPEPWLCPVQWGEPSKSSFGIPVLTGEEKKSAAKLLRAHGGAAVDLKTYLCDSNLAAAAMKTTVFAMLPPPPAPPSSIISSPEGMDPCVYHMMKTMLAEKAAARASASAKKVKSKPGSKRGKKRSLKEASDKKRPRPSVLNTALPSGVCSPPPGFSRNRKPRNFPSRHDGDGPEWVATREQLEGAKRGLASAKREAEQEKAKAELAATRAELAKAEAGLVAAEAEVLKAKTELTAAKRAAEAEQGRPESAIEEAKAKAKLAAAKRALEKELESAKAAAVHQLLCCEEHVRRRAEHALEGYQHWRTGHAPAGCTAWLAC